VDLSAYIPLRYRGLVWQMARREFELRYRGSVMGLAWSFFNPLIMLAVYTFVFREVFKARWGVEGATGGREEFALFAFAGLVIFNWFAEVIGRAPRLVVDQPNLVKKVVFPLPVLAWVTVAGSAATLVVNALVLLLAAGAFGHLKATALWLPVVWLPLVPLMLGLVWLLSSFTVYLRDVGQAIGPVVNILMFLSPVFYPVSALPERWQPWLQANPLTLIIEQTRAVVLIGQAPDFAALGFHALVGCAVALLGAWWFEWTRQGFADVI